MRLNSLAGKRVTLCCQRKVTLYAVSLEWYKVMRGERGGQVS